MKTITATLIEILFVVVLYCLLVSYSYAIDDYVQRAVLDDDWEKVYQILVKDSSSASNPLATMLLAHACEATNRNNQATLLFDSLNMDEAIQSWSDWTKSLLLQHPMNPIVLYLAADAKSRLGNLDEAIEVFTQALKLNDNFALAFDARGKAYDDKGEYDQAISDYTKAIEANPMCVTAYFNRGYVYATGKRWYDHAIADYTKALDIDPSYAKAYNNRGLTYSSINKYQQAIADFSAAIGINSRYAKAYNNRGVTYNHLRQFDLAIADYTKAIEIDPAYAEAFNNRGVAIKQQIEHGTVTIHNESLLTNTRGQKASITAKEIIDHKDQYEQAITDYDRALEIDPQYAAAYLNKGNACCRLGRYQDAIDAYLSFIKYATPEFGKYIDDAKKQIDVLQKR